MDKKTFKVWYINEILCVETPNENNHHDCINNLINTQIHKDIIIDSSIYTTNHPTETSLCVLFSDIQTEAIDQYIFFYKTTLKVMFTVITELLILHGDTKKEKANPNPN